MYRGIPYHTHGCTGVYPTIPTGVLRVIPLRTHGCTKGYTSQDPRVCTRVYLSYPQVCTRVYLSYPRVYIPGCASRVYTRVCLSGILGRYEAHRGLHYLGRKKESCCAKRSPFFLKVLKTGSGPRGGFLLLSGIIPVSLLVLCLRLLIGSLYPGL